MLGQMWIQVIGNDQKLLTQDIMGLKEFGKASRNVFHCVVIKVNANKKDIHNKYRNYIAPRSEEQASGLLQRTKIRLEKTKCRRGVQRTCSMTTGRIRHDEKEKTMSDLNAKDSTTLLCISTCEDKQL